MIKCDFRLVVKMENKVNKKCQSQSGIKFWNISSSVIKFDFMLVFKMENKVSKKCQSQSGIKFLEY